MGRHPERPYGLRCSVAMERSCSGGNGEGFLVDCVGAPVPGSIQPVIAFCYVFGITVINVRSTVFTDSALLNTRATSGSSKTATDPGDRRFANRFGLELA